MLWFLAASIISTLIVDTNAIKFYVYTVQMEKENCLTERQAIHYTKKIAKNIAEYALRWLYNILIARCFCNCNSFSVLFVFISKFKDCEKKDTIENAAGKFKICIQQSWRAFWNKLPLASFVWIAKVDLSQICWHLYRKKKDRYILQAVACSYKRKDLSLLLYT